jgi:thiamine-monophosphate kinase
MTNSVSRRPGEFELIAKLFAPLATAPGALELTDDAARATPPAECDLVVTADALVEGVHFFRSDPPDLIARKALRVNLSDLAAKGCKPSGYLLVLSIPEWIDGAWLERFANGLRADQETFGVSLLGGDTTSTPGPLTIAITAFGHVPQGAMLRRSGARPGDLIFVAGTIGDAGGGLACLKGEGASLSVTEREYLVRRFQIPEPRLALGRALLGVASAALDVSDGLLADLGHIAETSSTRIEVDAVRIPLSAALRALWPGNDGLVHAATAGDDYEIAFSAPSDQREPVMQKAEAAGVPVTEIGRVVVGEGVVLLDPRGRPIPVGKPGYTHF